MTSVGGHAQAAAGTTANVVNSAGEAIATATFSQASDQLLISIAFRNRTALVGTHAIHIHSVGRCDAPNFESAGPILNPQGKQHGLLNPDGPMAGDLPNLVIGPAGVAVYNLSAPLLTLDMIRGASLVMFAGMDDGQSQPEGNAGQRIACGVIGPTGDALKTSSAQGLDLPSAALIAARGGLLIVGGVLLRRGSQAETRVNLAERKQ